jgi:hypothetical protein
MHTRDYSCSSTTCVPEAPRLLSQFYTEPVSPSVAIHFFFQSFFHKLRPPAVSNIGAAQCGMKLTRPEISENFDNDVAKL